MSLSAIEQVLRTGVQHHQAGRFAEAETIYRQVLAQQPGNADAWNLLGMIAIQAGQVDAAIELYRKAISLSPGTAEFHDSLGKALHEKAAFDEAIATYRRAIELKPGFAAAYNHLGNALYKKGQMEEAIAAFRRSLQLNPAYAEAHNNLGAAFSISGATDDAIAEYRIAISLKPDYADALNNLGGLLQRKGDLDEAISAYRRVAVLRPKDAAAYKQLGDALGHRGKFDEVIAAYRKALEINPRLAEAHCNLGIALNTKRKSGHDNSGPGAPRHQPNSAEIPDQLADPMENIQRRQRLFDEAIAAFSNAIESRPGWATPLLHLGQMMHEQSRFEAAILVFQQAVQCEPDNSDTHNYLAIALAELLRFDEATDALNHAAALAPDSALTHEARGTILRRSGRGREAVESFRRAVEIDPESVSNWIKLGQTLLQTGRFPEVADCVREIRARQPDPIQAHLLMAGISAAADAEEMARITASLDGPHRSIRDRATLGFVLGKSLDGADRFDEAFAQYARANWLILQMRQAAGERYSSDEFARRIDDSIALWTPDLFQRVRDWGEPSELPAFIVGMPRSGTSLIEQIASSHPDVFGAGELSDITNLATSINPTSCEPASVRNAACKQLDRFRSLGGSVSRVIDKTPLNVEHLGLIAALFPRARIILSRRDPRDTCLSCFFQNFKSGNLFSFDLANCGRHHLQTDRIASRWLKVLPLRLLEVQYEDLVADLEGQSRRIIQFLDLPWNPACLNYHKTDRTVRTASSWQVRQPIYTRSVGRWRNYEPHLGPLLEALGRPSQPFPIR